MDVGVFVPLGNSNASPEMVRAVGRGSRTGASSRSGWPSTWCCSTSTSRSTRTPDGQFPGGADAGMLEPLHRPHLPRGGDRPGAARHRDLPGAAAQPGLHRQGVTDLDSLSGGRVDFGVGVGWLREEFEAVAMPFEQRGKRADEHIAVMKSLWTEDVSESGATCTTCRLPHVPQAGAEPAPADPRRRRERRGDAPGRPAGPGLDLVRPAAGRPPRAAGPRWRASWRPRVRTREDVA